MGGLFFFSRRGQDQGGGGMPGAGGPMGGQMGQMGKSAAKVQMVPDTGVTFNEVAGCDGAKLELMEVVDFLKKPEKYSDLGAKIPRGVILDGPPGTGKTLLAKAVAGEAGVPFFSCSGSEFVEMYVGVGASRVRDLFEQAKKNAPCIIFIDEIDAVGRQRGGGQQGGNDEREQTLNQILTEMDGFDGNPGIITVAATNRADVLDAALLRPGRFDRRVTVDLPDKDGRREILYEEIDYAIDRQTVGMVKETGTSFPNRQLLVAYHEAGHAITGALTPDYDMVTKVTILPRTNGAGGFTLFTPTEERLESGLYSMRYLKGQLVVALGGRVAGEIVFGKEEVTTGASGDLQQVRNIARRMVAQWGYSKDKLGATSWESPDGNGGFGPSAASAVVEARIDEEVTQLCADAYAACKTMLLENRVLLDELTEMLVEKETVDYQEMQALVTKYYPDGVNQKLKLPAEAALL